MKGEVKCPNTGCATYGSLQLVKIEKLVFMFGEQFGKDTDGNLVECSFCGAKVTISRPAMDDAQFPVGELELSDGVKGVLHDYIDPIAGIERAKEMVKDHVRGHNNEHQEDGSILTRYATDKRIIEVVTNPQRAKTVVRVAGEDYE